MPRTPDRFPGTREEEEIQFETTGSDPAVDGAIRFNGTTFRMKDSTGVFDPRAGSGISEAGHKILDVLVHGIAETSYQEITRDGGGKVTDVIYWTDNGKTTKIREANITRASGKVSVITIKQYDGGGSLVETLTGTITRASGKVASIDWVLS